MLSFLPLRNNSVTIGLSFSLLYYHSSNPLSPLHKGGGSTFSKLMEMGGDLKIFARKKVCLEMVELPYYIDVFLEITHDAAWKKSLDVFIFPLVTKMCYKIIA